MNAEELKKAVETYILAITNYKNQTSFHAGGVSMPQFKTYEDMVGFQEAINKVFPAATGTRFDSIQNPGSVTFNLPDVRNMVYPH